MESRIESILTNMINDETETIRPQSRIEVLLSQLAEKIENIDQSLTRYRGRVDSVADLPAAGEKVGDWYFVGLVTDTTMSEYAWNGTSWDPIGSSEITVSGLVSYAESQSLQDSEKLTARNNIGLGNVDNTADADKPISTATQTALNGKADVATTYTKTDVDTALSGKQNALSSTQLDAVNSGIDSTKVAQIETNKNNILKVADQTTKYNICDYTRVKTAQYPDSSTGATISFDSDSLEYTINGTTNSTGTLLSNIYFDTATTKAIPNGEWVAQIYPPHIQVTLNAVATTTTTGTSLRPLVFSVTADDTRSWVRIELGKNITFDNYKFKLMITPKSVWDSGFTSYQPYAMSNAELTAKEQQNKNNISTVQTSLIVRQNDDGKVLTASYSGGTGSYSWETPTALKSYIVSKPSDGSVNTATFDWSQLANGRYLITCKNVLSPTDRYGISVYVFEKWDPNILELWTPISDITNAKISSYVVSSDTLALTYDVQGYHTVKIVKIVEFNT